MVKNWKELEHKFRILKLRQELHLADTFLSPFNNLQSFCIEIIPNNNKAKNSLTKDRKFSTIFFHVSVP